MPIKKTAPYNSRALKDEFVELHRESNTSNTWFIVVN